jgi:NADH:ubiquinone oxidoreductase subunit H
MEIFIKNQFSTKGIFGFTKFNNVDILIFFISFILKFIFVLLSIAFITLFERKILGFSQNRLGPNKLLFKGILQPVIDGLKLLIKELFFPKKIIFWAITRGPFLGFLVILFL